MNKMQGTLAFIAGATLFRVFFSIKIVKMWKNVYLCENYNKISF